MKNRFMLLFCVAAFLVCAVSIAGAWDQGQQYTLHSTGIDPSFTVTRSVSWPGHLSQSVYLGVLSIEVWVVNQYNQGSQYYLGSLKTLCIDLDQTVYVPGTWNATWMVGLGSGNPDGLKGSDAAQKEAAWNRLTYAISNNGSWDSSGTANQKAGMQLAVWELMNGDSKSGADANWMNNGNFKVASSGPSDKVLNEAAGYLAKTASIGDWSGANYGWWSSSSHQDQLAIPGPTYQPATTPKPVPETSTMVGFGAALALNGLGVAGSKYYLKKRYNRITAQRYARRHISKLSMYLDVAVSVTVLVAVSPLLVLVTAKGALRSGIPVMFK